jgi:hypothetical protein
MNKTIQSIECMFGYNVCLFEFRRRRGAEISCEGILEVGEKVYKAVKVIYATPRSLHKSPLSSPRPYAYRPLPIDSNALLKAKKIILD